METTHWIGDLYTSTFGWNVLEDLAEGGPRLGASAGERRAHDRVKRAFREADLREIDEHTFEMPGWRRESAAIELQRPDELELDCIALPGSPETSGTTSGSAATKSGSGWPETGRSSDGRRWI